MKNLKLTIRIFAGMLALILMGTGAVPAFSPCLDGCGCHKQVKIRHHEHQTFHHTTYKMDALDYKDLNPYRYFLTETSGQHPACETDPVETCGMKLNRPIAVLNRTTPEMVQSDILFPESILQIRYQTVDVENATPSPGFKPWLPIGCSPVPLYLKNRSLIC